MELRQIIDRLFPPVVCGTNARMKALLAGQEPRTSVSAAEVEARWRRLRTPTAIERLNADVDRAVAAAEAQMAGEGRRRAEEVEFDFRPRSLRYIPYR
jgi:hypothetical protein